MKHTILNRLPQKRAFVFLTGALLLAGCNPPPPQDHPFRPEADSPYQKEWASEKDHHPRVLDLVDRNDNTVGTVKMYRDGYGKVLDTDGNVIGHIVPPDVPLPPPGHPHPPRPHPDADAPPDWHNE